MSMSEHMAGVVNFVGTTRQGGGPGVLEDACSIFLETKASPVACVSSLFRIWQLAP